MSYNNGVYYASFLSKIYSVWYRHMKVYTRSFFSNAFPPFFEPLIFLAGMGIGMGKYVGGLNNIPFMVFLASGLFVTSAMWTAAFETTFGTFIRLEFDKVYDGMLGAPLSVPTLILGEIFWCGTKGLFFSFAVLVVIWVFGIISYPLSILSIIIGFLTGLMFAALSLVITAFVKNINHFNFYMTGVISPMFFFSGVFFPVENLPVWSKPIVEILPLTHSVRLARAFCIPNGFNVWLFADLAYILVFTVVFSYFAVKCLKKRMIQ